MSDSDKLESPSVGDVVHFVPQPGACVAAVVTLVPDVQSLNGPDGKPLAIDPRTAQVVRLTLLLPNGGIQPIDGVSLRDELGKQPGTWHQIHQPASILRAAGVNGGRGQLVQ